MLRQGVVNAGLLLLACGGLGVWSAGSAARSAAAEKAPPAGDEALARTRAHAKMLDDLYKTAVVSITRTYVDKQLDQPAALVAQEVFAAMKKLGHHDARLIDASGKPKNKSNLPETEFEKKAVAAIKGGQTVVEEVGEANGQRVLRVGTIVPAVLKSCATCHGVKEGELLGVLVYELPIK